MQVRGRQYTVDWGHFVFVTCLAAAALWYLLDARSVSLRVNNLLLVQPLALIALALYLMILPQCFRRAGAPEAPEAASEEDPLAPTLPTEAKALVRIGILGVGLGVFVFSLNVVGFDIAIWLFSLATMAVCGERRPIPLIIYPFAVTCITVYGFRALMPYPMVTTIL
jgi:hypothetical protein